LQQAETKGDLTCLLAEEVKRFSLRDLEMMYTRFEEKTRNLPKQYRKEGENVCPVRDAADGVPFALCPFCPARQSDEPTYPEMRSVRKERRRKELLNNYRTNYKG
jgi:uncharacterized protein (UPF0305 family)